MKKIVQLWRYTPNSKPELVDQKETEKSALYAYSFPFMSNYYTKTINPTQDKI